MIPAAARKLRRWLLRALVVVIGGLLLLQLLMFARVLWWNYTATGQTSFMQIRLAELQQRQPGAKLKHQWVPYEKISKHLKRAMIASEDAKFVDHEGFDWEGIQKALEKNQRRGKIVAGGSTITQQLAKNLFLTPQRSLWRKAEETLVTLMIEATMDKRRIFEIYLNVIEWGNGVFGAEAAARHYFGIPAAQLSPWQAAWLAGAVPNPRFYDRNRSAPGLARKVPIILERMPGTSIP